MTKDEKIDRLEWLVRKFIIAFQKALDELQERGMTEKELFDFIDDINSDFEFKYEGRQVS